MSNSGSAHCAFGAMRAPFCLELFKVGIGFHRCDGKERGDLMQVKQFSGAVNCPRRSEMYCRNAMRLWSSSNVAVVVSGVVFIVFLVDVSVDLALLHQNRRAQYSQNPRPFRGLRASHWVGFQITYCFYCVFARQ